MGSHIPYPVLPYYLQLSEKVADSTPQPEPVAQIDLTEGPHLGYALQWFSFATISLLGGGYWLYRHLRLGAD